MALADDHVLLASDSGVGQEFLDVEESTGCAVDGVLAVARAEERPGDGHLGHVRRQLPRAVVDGQGDLGPAQGRPVGRPHKDDVFHLGRAHRAGALGAEHPGHGVDHIRFSAAVRTHDNRYPRLEFEHGRISEGLESFEREGLQEHRALTLSAPAGPCRCPVQTWQCSHRNVERPPVFTRTMTERHRRQACPSRS